MDWTMGIQNLQHHCRQNHLHPHPLCWRMLYTLWSYICLHLQFPAKKAPCLAFWFFIHSSKRCLLTGSHRWITQRNTGQRGSFPLQSAIEAPLLAHCWGIPACAECDQVIKGKVVRADTNSHRAYCLPVWLYEICIIMSCFKLLSSGCSIHIRWVLSLLQRWRFHQTK